MAILYTIEGTTTQGVLLRDSLCANHNYQEQIEDENGDLISNPESKADFAKRMADEYFKNNVKKYRVDQFEEGRATALSDAETEVDGLTVS